jgi:hypothetical protein
MVAPGTPTFTPPPYSPAAFTIGAVAVGATVTTAVLESTSPSAQTNVPFRFGQVFAKGAIAPGSFLVGKINGQADVPLQVNVLATHFDGSVRHAMVAGVLPSLAAGTSVTLSLVRASSGPASTPIAPSSFTGFAASAVLDFAGTAYTANAATALAQASSASARVGGAISTEYNLTLAPKTSGSVAHPDLEVKFDVVAFAGTNAFKVDVTFEHTKAFTTTGDLVYSGTIQVGGATVYTLPNPLTHYPHARWKRTYWVNNPYPVVVRQNRDYLIDSKAVPNYDRRVTVSESTLASYVTQMADPAFAPMGNGVFTQNMGSTGGRPDIGLLPAYAAAAALSMDKRAIAMALTCGDIGGSWSAHWRDVSGGPGTGMPLSAVNWPYATQYQSAADTNPATGQNEFMNSPTSASPLVAEESHTPNFAYLPYLLTGDLFYLEEMQFYCAWVVTRQNYSYRQKEKGIIQRNQVRGQAWMLRGIAENAAFTPDAHPLKSHFQYWLTSNITNYDAIYTNNAQATPLGCLNDPENDTPYPINGQSGVGIAMWQDDHFTSAVGHAVELGFTAAKPLLLWKAKFQIGRLLAPGLCYLEACFYKLKIKPTYSSSTYTTLAECYANTVGETLEGFGQYTQGIHDAPCNSQQRLDLVNAMRTSLGGQQMILLGEITGYAPNTDGYPANFQPALAMTVDAGYADGDLAWSLFDGRAVKPDYGTSPQFAIVPRFNGQAIASAPADIYQVASGQSIYGGRAAPVITTPTTRPFSGTFATAPVATAVLGGDPLDPYYASYANGRPFVVELHASSGSNWNANGRQYRVPVSGSLAIPGTSVYSTSDLDYDSRSTFGFSLVYEYDANNGSVAALRPIDKWYNDAGTFRESAHCGWVLADGKMHLVSERRYDALVAWAETTFPQFDHNTRVLTGGSMGGWGTASYGPRRYAMFAALYPDRPRWKHGAGANDTVVPDFASGFLYPAFDQAPMLSDEDGGGSLAVYRDMIAYVSNPANQVRPILWYLGRNDGFANFQDSIDMVAALRATKRAFCFVWDNGDHGGGAVGMPKIFKSYPFGTYRRDRGYPLFTEHSLDKDPAVDLVGSINEGLTFRNVVETTSGWSCDVTNVNAACTVKVEPISNVYTGNRTAKTVTITAANAWQTIQFP